MTALCGAWCPHEEEVVHVVDDCPDFPAGVGFIPKLHSMR